MVGTFLYRDRVIRHAGFASAASRFRLLTLFLLLTSPHPLSAQDKLLPVFHFNRWSMAEGLPTDGIRSRVVRDSRGFVWIGTVNGLEKFDGYTFKDYRNVPGDPFSLPSNTIMSLLLDRKGRLWVGTSEFGLSLYDPDHDRFLNLSPGSGDFSDFRPHYIHEVLEDRNGNIWVGTESEGVARLEIAAQQGTVTPDSLVRDVRFDRYPLRTPRNTAFDLFERKDGKIIAASDSGLIVIDPASHMPEHPHLIGPNAAKLNTDGIYCVVGDARGNLWVGTALDGVFRIDWNQGTAENYRHHEGDTQSIRSDNVWDIVEDPRGKLWIATIDGVDFFSPTSGKRTPFLTFGPEPRGSVRMRLSVDNTGSLWIGTTQDGLYRLGRKSLRFPHYSMRDDNGWLQLFGPIDRDQDGRYWLSSEGKLFQFDLPTLQILKVIDVFKGKKQKFSVYDNSTSIIDKHDNLWFGSSGLGLFKVNLVNGHVQNYGYASRAGKESIVWSIAQGQGDTLWTAAYYDGLMKFDPGTGQFLKLDLPLVANVMRDRSGNMWVATETEGVVVYDSTTGNVHRISHDAADPLSLSHNRTSKIYEDASRRIWISAGNAINLRDPVTGSFTKYTSPVFERGNEAKPIGSDSKGRLWISDEQLSLLDPSSGMITDFDISDGVCDYVIDMDNLPDGRVLLTGYAGLNIVNPDSLDPHRPPPPLVLTRMSINDAPVIPPILTHGSGATQLSYSQSVLEFEFAAMDIDAPQLVEYAYQLKGVERDWVKPRARRYVRYPGLAPGDYLFRVRARSSRNEWPEQEIELSISIAPPWWKSNITYAGYAILFLCFLYTGHRFRLRQFQLRQQVEIKGLLAEHLAEVDRVKSRFFANISHEFRTPLTLILGPLEILRSKVVDKQTAHSLVTMERNAKQLLRLVNQLLDLSRLDAGAMRLHASKANIIPVVKGITYSFESSAGLRGIELHVSAEPDEIHVYFDKEKVEKIFANLIANAFKFTREGGAVSITVRVASLLSLQNSERRTEPARHPSGGEGEVVEISVRDTGIGIPAEELTHVFDRFYQVDNSQTREYEGSGIGLALVKELVGLHHGEILVESVVGEGSKFTVRLPLGRNHLKDEEIEARPQIRVAAEGIGTGLERYKNEEEHPGRANDQVVHDQKPIVLLVEDNPDVSGYIKQYLPEYRVLQARDGIEGTGKAQEAIPDLIISDIMMPKRDGYELCRILKHDEKTSHIPIILLTARATSEDRLEGLETGADDYLVKPFQPKELVARVKNLIEIRRILQKRFRVPLKPGEVSVASMEDAFLKKLADTVEKHLGEEQFSVEFLAGELNMSRMQLHRKVKALTNHSASGFIRYMRLHRAMDLLMSNAGSVSEIAYRVGFSDPSHFAKRFQDLFGTPPSEVRKQPWHTEELPPVR
jgi:signal transduction histidine kinase/ligand-binding sensor domain-containing protein/DNA-binding response OmpR family regulator